MNWVKAIRCFTSFTKPNGKIFELGTLQNLIMNKFQKGTAHARGIISLRLHQERGCIASSPFQRANFGSKDIYKTMLSARNMFQHAKVPCCLEGNVLGQKKYSMTISRQFGQSTQDDPKLDRDFLVQLWAADKKIQPWAADKKMKKLRGKKDQAAAAPLLARSNLLITRDIEWANLVFGFEQENRYVIVDVCDPLTPAGYIYEKSNLIARQLLRLRRPFVAYITDAMGNEVFRVRRPFWLITSSIYVEIDGKEVGVVHRRWHLWRRVYDLYLGKKQFAEVENPGFWNWTFTLKDINGQVLAQIDRDWRGFGFELFTDAGQYVIRFGSTDSSSITVPAGVIKELEVICPLTLPERAVVVALAISLDNDYFSRHGRWGIPFIPVEE